MSPSSEAAANGETAVSGASPSVAPLGEVDLAHLLEKTRRAEAAARESEERLLLALDAGQMGTWELDVAADRVSWSPSLERMHGIPVGSFSGTMAALQRSVHPEDRDRVLATMARVLEGGEDYNVLHRVVRPDGEVRWLETRGKVIRDAEGGKVARLVGISTDATDRRRSEQDQQRLIREQSARMSAEEGWTRTRQILDGISDPVVVLDESFRFTFVNRAAERLTGRARDELLGASVWELFPEMRNSKAWAEYHRAKEEGTPVSFEEHDAASDRWYEQHVYPFELGVTVYSRDISARKFGLEVQARIARHASLRVDVATALGQPGTQREILQRVTDAVVKNLGASFARIWTLNEETSTLELDASAGQYTHLDGGHARIPVGKFKIGKIAETRRPVLTNEVQTDPRVGDKEWARREGMVAFAGYPLLAGDRMVGVLAMFATSPLPEDTLGALATVATSVAQGVQRHRAETELAARAEDLARSNAELERFAYVASHDLQEPLRMVASYTQLLGRRYSDKLDDDAKEFIRYAVDGVTRMQRLIGDLLEYSRVGTRGKAPSPTDAEEALLTTLEVLEPMIAETSASVTHDPLPVVMADEIQLGQLFQNLIGNGIKFRGPEGARVHVSVESSRGMATFSVKDEGIGIEPQYRDRVFVIFQRLHTREQYAGTGIGLAICKKIVERHGGRIWIEGGPGHGTTVRFTLPLSTGPSRPKPARKR